MNNNINEMREKTIKDILQKAEKYVRSNSIYWGEERYTMAMADWLYFLHGALNEVLSSQKQELLHSEREEGWEASKKSCHRQKAWSIQIRCLNCSGNTKNI